MKLQQIERVFRGGYSSLNQYTLGTLAIMLP